MPKRARNTPLKPETIEPQSCSTAGRLEILRNIPFFAGLSAADLHDINRLYVSQGYAPGETIYFAGDPATRLYVIAAGKVKVIRHSLGGQEVMLDILSTGECFGNLAVLGRETHLDTAQAQTTTCVLTISGDDFQTILLRYPHVALAALRITAARLKDAQDMIQQLSAHPAEQRIAAMLLKLSEKVGEPQKDGVLIQMPLSRQDLADLTGTTPETASRVMSQFRQAKLIRTGRQWVSILDRQRLLDILSCP